MTVTLYTFSKKVNSTARPSGGTAYTGTVRESSGTVNPAISFGCFRSSSPAAYNYAYITSFGRYYYIESWTFDTGLWYAQMRVDVLASWKSEIGASVNYVLRAAASYDSRVIDTLYPLIAEHTYTSVDIAGPGSPGGSYIVGIIGGTAGATGAVSYYQMSAAEFAAFASALLTTFDWPGFTFDQTTGLSPDGLTEETAKALLNPAQYIQSCKWVPWAPVQGTSVNPIPLGWWSINATAHPVTTRTGVVAYDITLPTHPDAATRGVYLKLSPFTRYTARIRPFGEIPLDSTKILDGTIGITISVDCISGDGVLQVWDTSSAGASKCLIGYAEKHVAVEIVLAQQTQNVAGAALAVLGGAVNGAGGILSGNVGSAIMSPISGIASAVQAMLPAVTVLGSQGSEAAFIGYDFVTADFAYPANEDQINLGRPLCQTRMLSTLAGYQLIANPEVSAPCSRAEHDEIISYLSSGYFYE